MLSLFQKKFQFILFIPSQIRINLNQPGLTQIPKIFIHETNIKRDITRDQKHGKGKCSHCTSTVRGVYNVQEKGKRDRTALICQYRSYFGCVAYFGVLGEEGAQVEELYAEVLCDLFSGFTLLVLAVVGRFDVDDSIRPILIHSIRYVGLCQGAWN